MSKPSVLITIKDGVAEFTVLGDVTVVLVDFDIMDGADPQDEIGKALEQVKALPAGEDGWNRAREEVIADLESMYDDPKCPTCGEVRSKDCGGDFRCEVCDDPCPRCYDGGGPRI